MSVSNRRLAVAGVLAATAIAVPAAALAAGSSPSKPVPSADASKSTALAASKSPKSSELPALAASAGISVSRLQAGLIAAKQAGGNSTARAAAFAAAAAVTNTTAQRIVRTVFGTQVDRSFTGQVAVRALATLLGVSTSAAQHALQQLDALNGNAGIEPGSPAFAAVAHGLGVSPGRLAAALDGVKQSLAGK